MKLTARRIVVTGRVQGVGYRPFVYVTAHELGIKGSVQNGSGKVYIHAEGESGNLDRLEAALINSAPPLARPNLAESQTVESMGSSSFEILASSSTAEAEIHVPPDLYTCDDCVKELTTRQERRYGYPFINCTQCGPRYTIITAMPYDRPNTSMAGFSLCDDCRAEYESPMDRRFHAQPLACPKCGPDLEFVVGASLARESSFVRGHYAAEETDREQGSLPQTAGLTKQSPIEQAVLALKAGQILAVKGVGGYHLVCDAANDDAVKNLRKRKHRPHKPLAVMFPLKGEDGLAMVREHLLLDAVTEKAILDPARPIVLIKKRPDSQLSPRLAPGLSELGAFLPYSPLHHQLLLEHGAAVVATSGNISGEPVITDPAEAEKRLFHIADAFLHHNRPIVRPADDSVIRPIAGRPRVIRLGRGIAPVERALPFRIAHPLLALGGHMKVTIALAWKDRLVISPHIGELDSKRSMDVFTRVINDLQKLYDVKTQRIVCDLHPGYASSRWAAKQGPPVVRVQHHAAHASALAGEHPDVGRWLVFTWDGVGYGADGTLWGGEALSGEPGNWSRVASFRPFSLVGGDKAGRQPWRSAAALLWAVGASLAREEADREKSSPQQADDARRLAATKNSTAGGRHAGEEPDREQGSLLQGDAIRPLGDLPQGDSVGASFARDPGSNELALAHKAWQKNINTNQTSAVGRLFDAAAALVLGRNMASFEGQGPMELEQIAHQYADPVHLPLEPDDEGILRSDWAPLLPVLQDHDLSQEDRSAIFHASLAQALVDQALRVREHYTYEAVGLSGGVFQNRLLTELVVARLKHLGIETRLHEEIPANDGGLCFGQVIEAKEM